MCVSSIFEVRGIPWHLLVLMSYNLCFFIPPPQGNSWSSDVALNFAKRANHYLKFSAGNLSSSPLFLLLQIKHISSYFPPYTFTVSFQEYIFSFLDLSPSIFRLPFILQTNGRKPECCVWRGFLNQTLHRHGVGPEVLIDSLFIWPKGDCSSLVHPFSDLNCEGFGYPYDNQGLPSGFQYSDIESKAPNVQAQLVSNTLVVRANFLYHFQVWCPKFREWWANKWNWNVHFGIVDEFRATNSSYNKLYFFYKGGVSWKLHHPLRNLPSWFNELSGHDRNAINNLF